MKINYTRILKLGLAPLVAAILILAGDEPLFGQGTAFTYQGRLADNGSLPNTNYDMKFSLWDSGGHQIGNTIPISGTLTVPVNGGLFTVTLNSASEFGSNAFTGDSRFLQIEISPLGQNTYTALSTRQQLTPSPYAIRAGDAGTLAGRIPSSFAPASGSSAYVAKNGDTMTGPLGIGTVPAFPLDVSSTAGTGSGPVARFTSDNGFGTALEFMNTYSGSPGPDAIGALNFVDNSGHIPGQLSYHHTYDDSMHVHVAGDDIMQIVQTGIRITTSASTDAPYGPAVRFIGDVNFSSPANLGSILFDNSAGTLPGNIRYVVNDNTYPSDTLVFRVGGNDRMQIYSNGTVSVPVLQINGADVAEPFEVSTRNAPKGSVMAIDEENPGQLKLSDRAYDNRVAGILSGANGVNSGILLKQQGFNADGQNVALSGRVYALADASYGAIRPGDLLTSSDTAGHCMRVTDHARAQGAIIGKAMSTLKEGKGMVLVLVSLQ